MKDVTSEEFRELRKRRLRWFPAAKLAMRWPVLLDAPTMDDKFRQMPRFPEDDPASIAAIEAEGFFTVTRKAEKEAEWRERYSGKKLPVPRIRDREARASNPRCSCSSRQESQTHASQNRLHRSSYTRSHRPGFSPTARSV